MAFFIDSLFEESDNAGVVIYHIYLFIFFTFVRIPFLMNITQHYESGTNKKIEDYKGMSFMRVVGEAAYMSMLAQTAWGLLDIIPISVEAKILNFIQTTASFLITGGIVTMKMAGQST